MAGLVADLASKGWHLSEEGLVACGREKGVQEVIKQALNRDFKDIGAPCIPEDINRGKVEVLKGPLVLMVTKVTFLPFLHHILLILTTTTIALSRFAMLRPPR